FAAAGRAVRAGESRFDPIAENWLNSPTSLTIGNLSHELRTALFADHGVNRGDLTTSLKQLTAS
ncbi:MAG: hypothetical protein JNM52_06035, partial [Betaproteobacteria bacterium]|nr:hypothetical protein [Betaproteobacteria bacterium]